MALVTLRRKCAPIAIGTLGAFLLSLSPVRIARAAEVSPVTVAGEEAKSLPSPSAPVPAVPVTGSGEGTPATGAAGAGGGGDKTGASSQAIALPQGAGKVQGMGESFSTDLSTGVASLRVPFTLPAARGNVQPVLALSYSSAGGNGIAGIGWDLGVSYVARQTDRGLPGYADPAVGAPWSPSQDRFAFNGGQEIVPICLVTGSTCQGALPTEAMPTWGNGWQYFRPRVEGSFLRFFWSPDHRTWRVQSKSGATMELGVPLAAPSDYGSITGGVESDPVNPGHIFRWNIVREYDTHGNANPADTAPAPVNVLVYQYTKDGGLSYLTDVYDTPAAAGSALSQYAHHARLSYDFQRSDPVTSYRRGWMTVLSGRLSGVDISSQTFGLSGNRQLVRRYHLAYDGHYHVSLLTSVQMEGRCAASVSNCTQSLAEDATGGFPLGTGFEALPPMIFSYQHVSGYDTSGHPAAADVAGYEPFDQRISSVQNSPNHSLDESLTDLFDVNADGLPDVLVTAPYLYNGNDAVFFNGAGGLADTFSAWQPMQVLGVSGESANDIRLDNPNVSALDATGDGVIDLVNMPMVKTYSVYAPTQLQGGQWAWQGRAITTASQQSPRVDFANNNAAIRVMDVNADGLVDFVFSSGTEYQTFLSLGRFPGGDTQYGHWDATTQSISNDPVTSCLPWDATPALLSDPDIHVADMNGDGLPDIVRVRPGDLRYWPGRGNGYWGTRDASACLGGSYGQAQNIVMTSAPQFGVVGSTETLLLDDVNGDGLDDVIKVEFETVYIWLNVDGSGWAGPHIVANAPARIPSVNRVRLVDMNGSGTRDLLYGDGSAYRYMDLNGGSRPWVLTQYQNGKGATTSIQYGTSTQQMLAAASAQPPAPWTSVAPMPIHVVTQVTHADNLGAVGLPAGAYVTRYTYRNPVYDGRQREFRGFSSVTETSLGDSNSPTSSTRTSFLLGQCENDESRSPDPCTSEGMWEDNPREALKGLPLVSEAFDTGATYESTAHHTYRLRKLYTGSDGREVRTAFESQTDTFVYDTSPFLAASPPAQTTLTDVELEATLGSVSNDTSEAVSLRATVGTAHVHQGDAHQGQIQDVFGNLTTAVDDGCIAGCASVDESITRTTLAGLPPGDPTGWAFRTVESYVTGSQTAGRRDDFTTSYDVFGEPVETDAVLSGAIPLDRFHETGAATAGNVAPSASQNGTVVVSKQQYDTSGFGLVTQVSAPNGRCRQITYDSDYGELAVLETEYVGANGTPCSGTPLNTVAQYDRGFGVVLSVTDLHGELSQWQYDGLGRLSAFLKPDPTAIGQVSATAAVQVQYFVPSTTSPYSAIHTQTVDGASQSGAATAPRDAWAYVDGLDRTIGTLAQADPGAGDGGQWIASGLTAFDAKGRTKRTYLSWFANTSPAPGTLPFAGVTPPTAAEGQRYDSFGRVIQTFEFDGTVSAQSNYHALSVDHWDAADLMPGPHQGTPTTVTDDGHGRTVATTERVHNGGVIESHTVTTTYLATGEPTTITRNLGGSALQVVRWMQYDSLGHLVLNVEPDTTGAFGPPGTDPGVMKAWRYAYDDSGELVGTSDARGCGVDYYYDAGGRTVAENFSPCLQSQAPYSQPNLQTGDGTEAYYLYDQADPDSASIPGFPATADVLTGRLASVSDRGSKSVFAYDGRGRLTATARQMAAPTAPTVAADALTSRYTSHWYLQTVAYDLADRALATSTGIDSDVTALLGAGGTSAVTTTYAQSGAVASVGSSYGPLLTGIVHTADDLVSQMTYGDVGHTTRAVTYDSRRRPSSFQTYRSTPGVWTAQPPAYAPAPTPGGTPSAFQMLLEDSALAYDAVDNPTTVRDYRTPAEWPAGAQPVTRNIQYDDLYRVTQVTYSYPAGTDPWVDPFAVEASRSAADPRLASPSPHTSFTNRILNESFHYDWLGNTTQTDDDAHGFYDRSLGTISNGTAGAGPYQLHAATEGTPDNALVAAYDVAGNVVGLTVQRTRTCLPSGSVCNQRFAYDWDEMGRMARARRWDLAAPGLPTDPLPADAPAVDLRYGYDCDNGRTVKTAVDAGGDERHTVYVFDTLELRRTSYGISGTNTTPDFDRGPTTEVGYLFGDGARLARLEYEGTDVPTVANGQVHVLLELSDRLGSANMVIDHDTSELVEDETYRAFGGADSDYRPTRWDSFREDYRFTGKEEDVEVGLTYFGERYFVSALGRWASPDPLTVHSAGADLNLYAYVHGELLRSTDPLGLDGTGSSTDDAWHAQAPAPGMKEGTFFALVPESKDAPAGKVTQLSTEDLTTRARQAGATIFVVDANSQVNPRSFVDSMAGLARLQQGLGLKMGTQDSTGSGGQPGGQAGAQPGAVGPSAPPGAPPPSGGLLMDVARTWNGDNERGNPAPPGSQGVPGGTGDNSAGAASRALYVGAAVVDLVTTAIGVGQAIKSFAKSGVKAVAKALRPCGLCFAAGTTVLTAHGAQAIETVHVGERVVSVDAETFPATQVDPLTWRDIRLAMANPDGSGDVLNVETLRPVDWIEQAGLAAHGGVFLSIPEMGLSGMALIESISAVPPIDDGPGNVVLSTVTHVGEHLHALTFEETGARLEPTASHPLFSREQAGWVAAGELRPGDHVATQSGWLTVRSNVTESGAKRVYNLEVEGAHSYYAGDAGVLSHNAGPCLTQGHHSWPKYLGGAAKQTLVKLGKGLHDAYHSGLDKVLPRRATALYYAAEKGKARMETLRTLLRYTRDFDRQNGTKLVKAMRANGFPL